MKNQICASVAAEGAAGAIRLIEKAEAKGTDLVEVRLDYLKSFKKIRDIARSASVPLIATNRQRGQGGARPQNEDERLRVLLDAVDAGFQYVDLELTTADLQRAMLELKAAGAKIIVSHHDFKQTPDIAELENIMDSQIRTGGNICKLVTTANRVDDNLSCLLLISKMRKSVKLCCFAMGKNGIISRVLSPLFGAEFTYASVEKGRETASGQPSITELKKIYQILGVEG
jgi:3-dehydroquinate dehydratase type I